MPHRLLQAHQLLLVHVAIEKLTRSKQNMWQNATKGSREWTGLTGLSLRRISLLVPYHQRRQKGGPWFESLLGNWGSYVWNVSPYACDIPPCESSVHRSHDLSLFPTPQLCISSWIKKDVVPLERNNKLKFWVCLSNCYLIVAGLQGELISAFLSPPAAGPDVHKARGCHTHSVCSTWANRL